MNSAGSSWEEAAAIAPPAAAAPSFEQLSIRLASIGELAAAVHDALDLSAIYQAVRRHARWLLDFTGCALVVAEELTAGYRVLAGSGAVTPGPIRPERYGWAGWVLANGQTVVAPAPLDAARFRQDQDTGAVASSATVALYLPLHDGPETIGVLVFSGVLAEAYDTANRPVAHLVRMQVAAAVRNTRLVNRLESAEAVLVSLAHAVEAKDAYTEGHCRRLGLYGRQIGQALGLPPAQVEAVYKGGILHDIGKIAIPEAILLKPGRLTDDEFRKMQEHVEAGVKICAPLRSLQACLPVIRHHHEHWNGAGYPDGLAEDNIPLLARIISVVDAYDAMTTTRPYWLATPVERACAILTENRGPQWDPAVIDCFLALLHGGQLT